MPLNFISGPKGLEKKTKFEIVITSNIFKYITVTYLVIGLFITKLHTPRMARWTFPKLQGLFSLVSFRTWLTSPKQFVAYSESLCEDSRGRQSER